MKRVKVRVPATTANIGPGFDCLGLALDLWNEATFTLAGGPPSHTIGGGSAIVEIHGEGENSLPTNEENQIVRAARLVFERQEAWPSGLKIKSTNRIPLASGLGSSAAANLCGLLGANALLGNPLSQDDILQLGFQLEGHADNLAAALLGRLVIVAIAGKIIITQKIEIADWKVTVVVPAIEFSTQRARAVLPTKVPKEDAVFNIGRTALLVEALREGSMDLVRKVLADRLHQPYRLPLIPGAEDAINAAYLAGSAAALSGAGPGVVAFTMGAPVKVREVMQAAFSKNEIESRTFELNIAKSGAEVIEIEA